MTGNDVFRRRLQLSASQREKKHGSGPQKCLFGPPNAVDNQALEEKIFGKNIWCFERRWNFNISEAVPTEPTIPVLKPQPKNFVEERHCWESIYEADYMAGCDKVRMSMPAAPNRQPVTLLFAPLASQSHSSFLIDLESQPEIQPPQPLEFQNDDISTGNNNSDNRDQAKVDIESSDTSPIDARIDPLETSSCENTPNLRNFPSVSSLSPNSFSAEEFEAGSPGTDGAQTNFDDLSLQSTSPASVDSLISSHQLDSGSQSTSPRSSKRRTHSAATNFTSEFRLRYVKTSSSIQKSETAINRASTAPHPVGKRSITDYMRLKKSSRAKKI